MHVAVLIVGFRNADDIVRCLGALTRSTHADFEVVICENGGHAAFETLTAEAPAKLPGGQPVRLMEATHNLGYAGGVNAALAASPGADAWWVLNPDTEAEPSALAALLQRLAQGDCEAVGCTIYLPNSRVQSYGGRWRAWAARAVSMGHGNELSAPVDQSAIERDQSYLNGACMFVSRRFIDVVGPMREDYFLYCEEVEWFLRGRMRGMRMGFAPEARVLHLAGTTTGSYDAVRRRPKTPVYLNERNKILVVRDCTPMLLPLAAVAGLMLLLIRYGKSRAWRQIGYGLGGWVAGLLNQRGPPDWIDTERSERR